MGSNTVFKLALIVLLFVTWPAVSHAQEPTPTPPPLPYTFQPADIPEGDDPIGLGDIVSQISFVNAMGSHVTTVWSILDSFAGGGVLGYLVIFLMGLWCLRWVSKYVYNRWEPGNIVVDVSQETNEAIGDSMSIKTQWAKFGHELRRKKIF